MHDSEAVFAALGQLHKLGVRVALDDFGTGYSSLSFLQKFPFDKIKIDRSFVNELSGAKEESRLIARAVVRFAVSLGKTTTAEGVETKEQLDVLRAEGCVELQGYYFSRPIPGPDMAQMLPGQAERTKRAHRALPCRRPPAVGTRHWKGRVLGGRGGARPRRECMFRPGPTPPRTAENRPPTQHPRKI